jgi:sulfur-oxidizing protein SoxX
MKRILLLSIAVTSALHLPLAHAADPGIRQQAMAMVRQDFQAKGIAGLDRLDSDVVQSVCNRYANKPPPQLVTLLQADQLAAIKLPADGKLLGDWKAGEALAQSGRGLTWSDGTGTAVGGNCYNCHQLSPTELSYGTLGPSLLKFGIKRGNTAETQRYVYGKIYNAKAFNLCSNMPRFGHIGALGEKQIKDLVALILDPESPVNK